jgi:hypothetical protein
MTATLVTIHIFLMLAAAWLEARQDAMDIAAHNHIDHVSGWLERTGFALVCILVLSFVAGSWWMVPGLALVSYGAFTPAFRYLLNKYRGLEWHYMSLSNWYDTLFIEIAGTRAGQLAYAVEIIALVLGIYITTL